MKLTDPCFDVLNEPLFYAKMVATYVYYLGPRNVYFPVFQILHRDPPLTEEAFLNPLLYWTAFLKYKQYSVHKFKRYFVSVEFINTMRFVMLFSPIYNDMKQNLFDASHVCRLMLMGSTRLQLKKKSPSIAMSISLEVMIVGNSAVADPGLQRGREQHTNLPNFPKNCMKLKEFGPPGGRASLTPPPLDPLLLSPLHNGIFPVSRNWQC